MARITLPNRKSAECYVKCEWDGKKQMRKYKEELRIEDLRRKQSVKWRYEEIWNKEIETERQEEKLIIQMNFGPKCVTPWKSGQAKMLAKCI